MKIHIELDTLVQDDLAAVLRLLTPKQEQTLEAPKKDGKIRLPVEEKRVPLTKRVVAVLEEYGSASPLELSQKLSVSLDAIRLCLQGLRGRDIVQGDGNRSGARYWLKSKGDEELAAALPKGTKVEVMG
jgi:hypothetical protein